MEQNFHYIWTIQEADYKKKDTVETKQDNGETK